LTITRRFQVFDRQIIACFGKSGSLNLMPYFYFRSTWPNDLKHASWRHTSQSGLG